MRCDIEMIDPQDSKGESGVHVAGTFRINGEDIWLLPSDATISVTAGPSQPTIVTVTLMATSLRIAPA